MTTDIKEHFSKNDCTKTFKIIHKYESDIK